MDQFDFPPVLMKVEEHTNIATNRWNWPRGGFSKNLIHSISGPAMTAFQTALSFNT